MTRFEEIICSSETARVFMSVCDVGRTGFVAWLYDWQGIIGAYSTIAAGTLAGLLISFQIYEQRKKDNVERTQKKKAVLIKVPHALVEIGKYLDGCFDAWEMEQPHKRPAVPDRAIDVIMSASAYVDSESFESFRQLIICSQTFESRLASTKKIRPINQQNMMIADIATYSYLNNRLFRYARMDSDTPRIPYAKPTRDDLHNELFRTFNLTRLESDPIFARIETALDERFFMSKKPTSAETDR